MDELSDIKTSPGISPNQGLMSPTMTISQLRPGAEEHSVEIPSDHYLLSVEIDNDDDDVSESDESITNNTTYVENSNYNEHNDTQSEANDVVSPLPIVLQTQPQVLTTLNTHRSSRHSSSYEHEIKHLPYWHIEENKGIHPFSTPKGALGTKNFFDEDDDINNNQNNNETDINTQYNKDNINNINNHQINTNSIGMPSLFEEYSSVFFQHKRNILKSCVCATGDWSVMGTKQLALSRKEFVCK